MTLHFLTSFSCQFPPSVFKFITSGGIGGPTLTSVPHHIQQRLFSSVDSSAGDREPFLSISGSLYLCHFVFSSSSGYIYVFISYKVRSLEPVDPLGGVGADLGGCGSAETRQLAN